MIMFWFLSSFSYTNREIHLIFLTPCFALKDFLFFSKVFANISTFTWQTSMSAVPFRARCAGTDGASTSSVPSSVSAMKAMKTQLMGRTVSVSHQFLSPVATWNIWTSAFSPCRYQRVPELSWNMFSWNLPEPWWDFQMHLPTRLWGAEWAVYRWETHSQSGRSVEKVFLFLF